MAASKKSLMPEGFREAGPHRRDQRPAGVPHPAAASILPLDLRKAATIVSTHGMFYDEDAETERLIFPDWSPKIVDGVPFALVDPQGEPGSQRRPAVRPARQVPAADAQIGRAPLQRQGQGDPLPERRQRLGLSLRPQGKRLDDRPAALRRRHGRGPPAGKRRPLRGLYPRRRRARLEARLQAPRPADPLPRRRIPRSKTRSSASSWSRAPTESAPIVMAVTVEVADGRRHGEYVPRAARRQSSDNGIGIRSLSEPRFEAQPRCVVV